MVALSPSMRMALLQVFNFPLDGPNSLLFLESKALELINLHVLGLAMQSHRPPPNGSGYIAPNDREKLHAARDILTRELAEPPTISALSRRVGLNECKLKQIFKVHFKTTIFGFVQNERMRLAKTLLEEGMSVSQAASALGYVNFSHFSSAFRKHYGDIPSHFKRRT
jgi:AraC-like DNA-binding protein